MVQLSMGWPLTGEWVPHEALFVKLLWPLVIIIIIIIIAMYLQLYKIFKNQDYAGLIFGTQCMCKL